ncbi:MAG: translation elongation factor Ts [Chlamydia sp.]
MSTISAALVKELRDRTGVGMSKCKEALDQSQGDMEKAIELLRKQGMASAVKKEGRETKEGVIVFHAESDVIGVCEINAETDFVAKNERFLQFANAIAKEIATTKPASLELFLQQPCSHDAHITIDQYRSLVIQTIGENIQIRRFSLLHRDAAESIGLYSHMNGKIVTSVTINAGHMESLAKDVAMHVAAAAPEYLNPESIPQSILEKEREIAREQVQGKPAYIMDKIIDGKINAFYDAQCLTRQKFIKDDSLSVEAYVKKQGQLSGKEDFKIVSFLRWSVGQ